jgi:orotate phosphoribosyltransferase
LINNNVKKPFDAFFESIIMNEYARIIAKAALRIGAIKLNPGNPFQWASGYRMPIYNDNRMFLYYPEYRNFIRTGFEEVFKEEKPLLEVIAGTSTAGIPWAAMLAMKLEKPMIYIRDKPKDHGLRNQIEGIDADKGLEGKSVVVIEDLISTGGSSAAAVQGVINANGKVPLCVSIFSYGLEKAMNEFTKLTTPCTVRSLLTYDDMLAVAIEANYITDDQLSLLKEWRADPFGWGEKHGFPKIEKKKE